MLDVVQKVSGNMLVVSSWADTDKAKAKQDFHDRCRLLYSDAETTGGVVALLDDKLDVVDGCKEFIVK